MELILICGILLSILSFSIYFLSTFKTTADRRFPPGKTGWPMIGESPEFLSNLKSLNLEKFSIKRMAKYSPDAFKTSVLGDQVAVLCGVAGNKFLLSKANKLVKMSFTRPVRWMLSSDEFAESLGQYVKPQLIKFLKKDGMTSFLPVIDAIAQQHLQSHWHGVQEIRIYPSGKKYAFAVICRLLMSIEDSNMVDSLFEPMEAFTSGIRSAPINLPWTRMNRAIKARTKLKEEIHQIVRHQRSMESSSNESNKNDFLTQVLQACEDDNVIVAGFVGLLLAGHETIASVICMVLKVMADQPHVYRRVYQENMEIGRAGEVLSLEDTHKMIYTWNVVREVMRLYPPAPFLYREALTDFTYAGYDIPKGHKLLLNIHATHKDPKYFPEPQKFDPSRFEGEGPLPYTYLPFGGGSYLCPGMNYAQLVILVFVHNIVKRFKWESSIADHKITGIPFPKPSQGFPIILHPHTH